MSALTTRLCFALVLAGIALSLFGLALMASGIRHAVSHSELLAALWIAVRVGGAA